MVCFRQCITSILLHGWCILLSSKLCMLIYKINYSVDACVSVPVVSLCACVAVFFWLIKKIKMGGNLQQK